MRGGSRDDRRGRASVRRGYGHEVTVAAPLRVGRSAVVASLATGLALGGHVAGGGAAPPSTIVLVLVVLGVVPLLLLRRLQLGPARILAALAVGQWVSHQVFAALGSAHCVVTSVDAHGGAHGASSMVSCEPVAHVASAHAGADTRMLVGHAVATLLTGAMLAHGERVALWLWSLVAPRVDLDVPPAVVDVVLRRPARVSGQVAAPVEWRAVCSPLRGPPSALVLA